MFNIYMFKDKFLKSVHGVEVVSGVNLDGPAGVAYITHIYPI